MPLLSPSGAFFSRHKGQRHCQSRDWLEFVCQHLLRAWVDSTAPQTGLLACVRDPRLSRVLQHIHANPQSDLDLSALSRIAGMSRTAFAIRFRQILGVPPKSYLTDWRMLKARNLLVDTDLAIEDIVEQVGYGSVPAFSRAFKRKYGETPGGLRQVEIGS